MMRQPSSLAAAAMLAVALAVALTASTAAAPWERADEEVRHLYEAWKSEHGRLHGDDDDLLRLEVFRDNLRYIDAHNAEADMGLHSYRLGLTPFADLTLEEFHGRQLVGFQSRRNDDTPFKLKRTWYMPSFGKSSIPATDIVPATAIDWRKNGAVTGIRNQGNKCGGGSWAFSAVAAMEGVHKIATGKLVSLSEQELLDCDTKNHGCKGGRMDYAFQFVIRNGGIASNDDYPYTGRDETCDEEKKQRKVVSIDSWSRVPPNNEQALQMAVSRQPVSVVMDAGSRSFQHYTSGVFDGDCGTKADHGVIAVGYGSENGKDFWIVKNSWGPRWGEAGYVRIARNVPQPTGKCGIAMDASFPVKQAHKADMTLLPEMALA